MPEHTASPLMSGVALWICNAAVCGSFRVVRAGVVPTCDLAWSGHAEDRSMTKVWEGPGDTRTLTVVGKGEYEQWGPVLAFERAEDAEAIAAAVDGFYVAGEIEVVVR